MGFNCYLGEYILVLVIFFWVGGGGGFQLKNGVWLFGCLPLIVTLSYNWVGCTTAQCEHSLNVSKSKFIIFHPPQKKLQQIPIKINSENIPEKNSTKYLGVIMDKHLNKERTYSLKILNYKSIGQLSKLRHYISQKLLMTIYFAFLQPH